MTYLDNIVTALNELGGRLTIPDLSNRVKENNPKAADRYILAAIAKGVKEGKLVRVGETSVRLARTKSPVRAVPAPLQKIVTPPRIPAAAVVGKMVDGETARALVKTIGPMGLLPVGSYGRDSHAATYKDLDFLTFEPLHDLFVKMGGLYMQLILGGNMVNGIPVDIWHVDEDTFYEVYVRHMLAKQDMIRLNIWLREHRPSSLR